MGSNQSTSDSFSVDPSGKISHKQAQVSSSSSSETNNTRQRPPGGENIYGLHPSATIEPVVVPLIVPVTPEYISVPQPSLEEANEIVTRLKMKHKDSRKMAGKHQSVFEEAENNLVKCYAANKGRPLNCSKVSDDYRSFVYEQRRKLLKESVNQVPLMTTILVIITCILLHITTVSCFGAMSIDLGSEWMKVGLVAPSVQMDIVLNAQSQRKTPMAIAFSNGERFIGDTALDVASKYPEKAYTHFLDLVGKTIDDESVQHYKRRFPHAVIKSHEPNSTSIILNHPEGLSLTPLELIATMIQHAHDQVTNRLSNNEPAYDVVITVPPFFNSKERRVIKDAAKLVGLNVLRLTNVNSAFALSYGIFRHKDYLQESRENTTSILFFDQGASHTSATLADYHLVEQIDEATGASKNESLPTVTIRAQVYDRFLGGFDMQLKLRDHLVKVFAKENKIDEARILKRGRSAAKLLKESGRVKKVLSANADHTVRVENVIDDKDLKHPITRKEYEELNHEYLDTRIRQLLDSLFEMPSVSRDDRIESVIIVGGNTRTPKIQQALLEYFKLETLGKSINADEGAALAALYQAASLGRGFRVKKFILEEFGEERRKFNPANETTEVPPTDDAIYSESELDRIGNELAHMREQEFLRLQRLSLKNSLESLLSEGRDKLQGISEDILLEDNITILADKYAEIYEIVHPRPPPPPPPQFDPTTVDLSSVLNNDTFSILDALNFTTNFTEDSSPAPSEVKPPGPPHSEL